MDIRQCYDTLEVSPGATAEEIDRHYRDLVNVWHPDRFSGNPRLQKKAGEKLAKINAAYDAVMAHLSSGCGFSSAEEGAPRASGKTDPGFGEGGQNEPEGENQPPRRWATERPRFGYWKLVVPLMLVSLLMASGMILSKIENLMGQVRHPTDSLDQAVDRALNRLTGTDFGGLEKPGVLNGTTGKKAAPPGKPSPPKPTRYIEIYLKNGDVIVARSYTFEDDMIVYHTAHGSIGILKSKVKEIHCGELKGQ